MLTDKKHPVITKGFIVLLTLYALYGLIVISLGVAFVCVVAHFIAKYW